MNKQALVIPFKLIGLALGLIIALWFINLELRQSVLSVTLEKQTNVDIPINAFFKADKQQPFLVQGKLQNAKQKETIFFPIPGHFQPTLVSLVPAGPAADWKVYEVGIRSRFFIFDLLAYKWPLEDLQLSKNYPGSTLSLEKNSITFGGDNNEIVVVLPIDEQNLSQTTELIFAKLFYVAVICLLLYWLFGNYFIWSLIAGRAQDYQTFKLNKAPNDKQNKYLALLSASVFVLVIVVLRFPLFAEPGIFIEDAMEMSDVLSGAAQPLKLESYFYYRGYYVVLTELIAHFTNWFPLAWQPSMYLWFGLLSMCAALCVFSYSGLFKSRLILLIAPIVFCLGSFTGPLMYLTITSILFSSTVFLMAIAVRPTPNNNYYLGLYALVVFILAWSGPYTPQLLPLSFALLLLHSNGRKNLILVLILVLALLYTLSAASGMVQLSNILDSSVRVALFDAIIHHIFFLELLANSDYKYGLVVICLIALVLYCFRKDRSYLKHSLAFLGASLASIATYFLSFKYQIYAGVILDSHTVIAQFCWLVFLFLTTDKLLALAKTKPISLVLNICLCVGVVTFLYAKDKVQINDYELVVDKQVPHFLNAVEQAQKITLKDNEFLQLWYVNQFKQVASVYFGDAGTAVKSIDVNQLPKAVKRFAVPFSLDRELNNVLYYNPRANTIGYSHTGKEKKLPKWDKL